VAAGHDFSGQRPCYVLVQKTGDPGESGKGLPGFLGCHLSRKGGGAAVQRTLIDRTTPAGGPCMQERHSLADAPDFFHGMSLSAQNPNGRKEVQSVHCLLRFSRDVD
jgi:hypothetical protein